MNLGRLVNANATTYNPSALGDRRSPTTAWSTRNASTGEAASTSARAPKRNISPTLGTPSQSGGRTRALANTVATAAVTVAPTQIAVTTNRLPLPAISSPVNPNA